MVHIGSINIGAIVLSVLAAGLFIWIGGRLAGFESVTLGRALLAALGSLVVFRVGFVVLLDIVETNGFTIPQSLYLIACISSVLGVVLVIKGVLKVRLEQAFLLWICYSGGEVAGSFLAFHPVTLSGWGWV